MGAATPGAPHTKGPRRRWAWRSKAAPQESSGGGSNGGGGGSTGGGDEGSDDEEEEGGGLARNIWVLVLASAAALGLFKVSSKKLRLRKASLEWLQGLEWPQGQEWQQQGKEWLVSRKEWLQAQKAQLQGREWPQGEELQRELQQRKEWLQAKLQATFAATSTTTPASAEDVAVLIRLCSEAFAELVNVKERLDALEQDAGLTSTRAPPADATPVSSSSSGSSSGGARRGVAVNGSAASSSTARHRLSGMVRLGGGLMWAEDGAEAESSDLLRVAGVKLGTDVLLQLAGLLRGGRDSVHAECKVDTAAEQLSLRKVLYSSRIGSHLRLVLAPFGARGRDAAYTLNPLAGQGLTSMVRDGSPLHRPVLGSLVGLGLEASRAWLNAGYFARASPEGSAACSLLAQAVVAPFNSLSVGATYLEHRSEVAGGAGAGTNGAEAAEVDGGGGGLQRPAMLGALQRFAPLAAAAAAATGGASVESERQLGATLAWKLGDAAVLHGWAAADGDEVERRVRSGQLAEVRPSAWGLLLGSYPDGSGSGWAFGVGRSATAEANGAGSENGTLLVPNLFELNLQFNMGDGLLLTPAMLLMKQASGRHTAFLGLKSAWAF